MTPEIIVIASETLWSTEMLDTVVTREGQVVGSKLSKAGTPSTTVATPHFGETSTRVHFVHQNEFVDFEKIFTPPCDETVEDTDSKAVDSAVINRKNRVISTKRCVCKYEKNAINKCYYCKHKAEVVRNYQDKENQMFKSWNIKWHAGIPLVVHVKKPDKRYPKGKLAQGPRPIFNHSELAAARFARKCNANAEAPVIPEYSKDEPTTRVRRKSKRTPKQLRRARSKHISYTEYEPVALSEKRKGAYARRVKAQEQKQDIKARKWVADFERQKAEARRKQTECELKDIIDKMSKLHTGRPKGYRQAMRDDKESYQTQAGDDEDWTSHWDANVAQGQEWNREILVAGTDYEERHNPRCVWYDGVYAPFGDYEETMSHHSLSDLSEEDSTHEDLYDTVSGALNPFALVEYHRTLRPRAYWSFYESYWQKVHGEWIWVGYAGLKSQPALAWYQWQEWREKIVAKLMHELRVHHIRRWNVQRQELTRSAAYLVRAGFGRDAVKKILQDDYHRFFPTENCRELATKIAGKLETQAGPLQFNVMSHIKEYVAVVDPKGLGLDYWTERISETLYVMYRCPDWVTSAIVVKMLLCEIAGKSSTKMITEWFNNLCKDREEKEFWQDINKRPTMGTQAGKDTWQEQLQGWIQGVSTICSSELAHIVMKLISAVAALGICRANGAKFCVQAFEKWFADGSLKKASQLSITMAILTVVKDFCVRGYAYFTGTETFTKLFGVQKDTYHDELAIVIGGIAAFESGQIERLEDTENRMMTEEGYMLMLDRVSEQTKSLALHAGDVEKRILDQKKIELMRVRTRVVAYRTKITLRAAPFAFLMEGGTGVGKTGISPLLVQAISVANGFCTSPEVVYHMNPHDKYDTNYQNWTVVVMMDDTAAIKAEHEEGCLPDRLLRLVNNEPITALKADVDSKGKVYMAPKIVAATTNKWHLETHVKMNEPVAAMRRFAMHIETRLRDEYKHGESNMLNKSKMTQHVNDAWVFTVRHVVPGEVADKNRPTPYNMVVSQDDEGPLLDIGIDRLTRYAVRASREHFEHQNRLLRQAAITHTLELCPHDSFAQVCPQCANTCTQAAEDPVVDRMDPEWKKQKLARHYVDIDDKYIPPWLLDKVQLLRHEDGIVRAMIQQKADEHAWVGRTDGDKEKKVEPGERCFPRKMGVQAGTDTEWNFMSPAPERSNSVMLSEDELVLLAKLKSKRYRLLNRLPDVVLEAPPHIVRYAVGLVVGCMLFAAVRWLFQPVVILMLLLILYGMYELITAVQEFRATLKSASGSSMNVVTTLVKYKHQIAAGFAVGGILTVVAALTILVKSWESKPKIVTQGGGQSIPEDPIRKENAWLEPTVVKPRCSQRLATSTWQQVVDGLKRRTATARFHGSKVHTNLVSMLVPYKGNTWIVPYHVMKNDFAFADVRRTKGHLTDTRTVALHRSRWIRIEMTDMCLVTMPEAGEVMDYSEFYPDRPYQNELTATWIFKDKNVDCHHVDVRIKAAHIEFEENEETYAYQGWKFKLDRATQKGMCMAPLVSKGVVHHIVGFHSAGVTGEFEAAGCALLRGQLSDTYRSLFEDRASTNFEIQSEGNMQLEVPEKSIALTHGLHEKSPFRFQEHDGTVELYGSHTGKRREFRSSVRDSYISASVTQRTGVENEYGPPPKMNSWTHWQLDASKAIKMSNHDPQVLEWAYQDLLRAWDATMKKHPTARKYVKVLSQVEALSGLDGVRGIDRVKLNTSTGWPECKKKGHFVVPLEEYVEGITCPLKMQEPFATRLKDLLNTWRRGERAYCINQMHLKDEPTKKTKEKVRIMAGCTLEFLVAVKMYFGGILKFMLEHKLEFETAVGTNATSPEWSEVYEYVTNKGPNMINGDFKGFDICTEMIMILLAFKLMIEIGKWGDFLDDDIVIMRGIVSELAAPVCEYNGEFVMWFMRTLSGHGATVNINGVVNSLENRYAYYDAWQALRNGSRQWIEGIIETYPHSEKMLESWCVSVNRYKFRPPDFNEVVSLLTYGDDNIGSVMDNHLWYNHMTIAYSLSKVGVTYTMADKTEMKVAYIPISDCSFLKRRWEYNAKLGVHTAPLEMDSLYKTLHSNLKSKCLTSEEQSADAIKAVMNEIFHHGRSEFERMRRQLSEVIEDKNMWGHWYERRLATYEEQEELYVSKYLKPKMLDSSGMNIKNESSTLDYDVLVGELPSDETDACTC